MDFTNVSHITTLCYDIALENILKYTVIKKYRGIISHIISHIHIKQKQKVKQEKRNKTHSKTKLTDLHYIVDKDHNDSK